jgi:hypothetical protein
VKKLTVATPAVARQNLLPLCELGADSWAPAATEREPQQRTTSQALRGWNRTGDHRSLLPVGTWEREERRYVLIPHVPSFPTFLTISRERDQSAVTRPTRKHATCCTVER